jgi:hypothetical protein
MSCFGDYYSNMTAHTDFIEWGSFDVFMSYLKRNLFRYVLQSDVMSQRIALLLLRSYFSTEKMYIFLYRMFLSAGSFMHTFAIRPVFREILAKSSSHVTTLSVCRLNFTSYILAVLIFFRPNLQMHEHIFKILLN